MTANPSTPPNPNENTNTPSNPNPNPNMPPPPTPPRTASGSDPAPARPPASATASASASASASERDPGTNLRIRGLTKTFGGVKALDGVDLTVPAGQVHALLGHNGAGKSTLIKCLGGAFPPDAGTIEVDGTEYTRLSPRQSIAAGVAIIFQTLSVADSLTVAENIFLGQEWTRYGTIDRRAQETLAAGLLERVAASCSPRDRVGELPMGQRQLVEIAKALSRSASVLVLDEPTAALSGTESHALAERVEDLRTQGLAIVYVTHLLSEVERLADAVTVLRDGRVDYHSPVSGHTRGQLVDTIIGRGRTTTPRTDSANRSRPTTEERSATRPADDLTGEAQPGQARPGGTAPGEARPGEALPTEAQPSTAPPHQGRRAGTQPGETEPGQAQSAAARTDAARTGAARTGQAPPAGARPDQTQTRGVRSGGARSVEGPVGPGRRSTGLLSVDRLTGPGFGPVRLEVAGGEIVGLYGLIGSGRTRILETLFGRRRRSGGTVRVGGRQVAAARPADALAAGIALVPADRRGQGLFATLSAQDNVLLPAIRPLARGGLRSLRAERRTFEALASAVGLRPARPQLPAAAFSGGNQQKLVLGRWINDARGTDVLLLDDPTQGVDVGARQEIYRVVEGLAAERGTAVLFASSDPEEIVALAHRCLIVARGRVVRELAGGDLTEEALLSAVHDTPAPTDSGIAGPRTAEGAA